MIRIREIPENEQLQQFSKTTTVILTAIDKEKSVNAGLGLIILVALIVLFGLTMLYSTSSGMAGSTLFIKQIIWVTIGIVGAIIINIIGYKKIITYSGIFVLISLVLLFIADFFCPAINGAHRWIRIYGISIQPSEFAKLSLIMFLAKYCADEFRYMNTFGKRGLIPASLVSTAVLLMIFLGKDWGATALTACVVMIIFFICGVKLRYFLLSACTIPFLILYLKVADKERWSRLVSFLEPEKFQKTDAYQLWHSLLALGSGGWFGLGFTQSRMKEKYLPEAHTDFILSIVGEELGFVFICLVIIAYIAFFFLSLRIAMNANDRKGLLLAIGITSAIILQAIINIGVVSGAFPTKGMPAPFISYGGSNMVMCLCAVGFLVNIAFETGDIEFTL